MATESELLSIRPRLRNDAVFLRVDTGVYLRHSENACVLKGGLAYQWMSILGPRMNGEFTVGELCDGLEEAQRQTVLRLTGTLLAQGFVRDVPSAAGAGLPDSVLTRFRPQINLIEHFAGTTGESPAVRFGRFRAARALVAGASPVLTAVVQGLVRNGMAEVDHVTPLDGTDVAAALEPEVAGLRAAGVPVTLNARAADVTWPDYDIVVFAAEGDGLAELLAVSRRLRDAEGSPARLLPVVTTGERVVIGPLTGTTTGPCWVCAQLRLSANGDAGMAADLWREIALGEGVDRATPASGTVPAMVGNAAALETFRLFSAQLSELDQRHVVIQDATTLESTREPLLPHPACPLCRDLVPEAGPATGPASAVRGTFSGASPDEELYERIAPLLSPRIGVLSGWADEALEQIPMKIGRVRVAGSGELARGPRTITAYHPETFLHARMAAVRSALRWYAGTFTRRPDVVTGTQAGLSAEGHHVVPDASLLTWSGLAPATDGPRPYVPAVSLVTGNTVLVPQAAAYPLTGVNRDAVFERTAAGGAAGRTREEIVAAGLADALGRRGLIAAVRGTEPAFELPGAALERDEEAVFARTGLGHLGRSVRAYALPGARPAYAVLAVVDDGSIWAVGAALSPRDALRAALRDALGQAQTTAAEGAPADLAGSMPADFDPRTAWAGAEAGTWDEDTPPVDTDAVLAALASGGGDAYLVDTTTADLRAVAALTTGVVLLAAPASRPDAPG
jgi:bacteriocin biosynthesis cyclodehydratase domain-containing protein